MNDDGNEKFSLKGLYKYLSIGMTAFLVIVASIGVFFIIFEFNAIKAAAANIFSILRPFIIGAAAAYLLNPMVNFFDSHISRLCKKLNGRFKPKLKDSAVRSISIFLSLVIGLSIIAIILNLVIPELIRSITSMLYDLPSMMERSFDTLLDFVQDNAVLSAAVEDGYEYLIAWIQENMSSWTSVLSKFGNFSGIFNGFNSLFNILAVSVKGILGTALNIIIGIIVSVYLLSGKEKFVGQAKKLLYAAFPAKKAGFILDIARESDRIFSGFIVGQLIDAAVVGMLCFLGMSALRLPYPVLISVLVGASNVIPFFGPYMGAIPSIILILLISPWQALYFLIFILILQQVDGNIINPKILGNKTGLTAFWVIFAITLGGGLMGFAGMIISVPALAVILNLINRFINSRLKKKNMPVRSDEYIHVEHINDNGEITYISQEAASEDEASKEKDMKDKNTSAKK